MALFEARPVSVSIARPAAEVYAFAHRPESLSRNGRPAWARAWPATAIGWIAQGPDGDVRMCGSRRPTPMACSTTG
jgi:hypothetical protein